MNFGSRNCSNENDIILIKLILYNKLHKNCNKKFYEIDPKKIMID